MTDYSSAITALIIVTVVISAAVVYVLAQPTDLPRYKENDPRSKEDDSCTSITLAFPGADRAIYRLGS